MSNTRFNYDTCRSVKKIQESTDPCRYMLNTPGPGCNPCFVEDPHIRLQKIGPNLREGSDTTFTDITSDLRGLTRPLSKDCYSYKEHAVVSKQKSYETCYPTVTDETRATHPAWMYRDLEQTRWYPLFYKPEDHAVQPFAYYINSSNEARDNFVPKQQCMFNN